MGANFRKKVLNVRYSLHGFNDSGMRGMHSGTSSDDVRYILL